MTLRQLRDSDVPTLLDWLPRVAKAIECDRWSGEAALRDAIGRSDVLQFSDEAGAAFVAYTIGAPRRNVARIDLIAVAPERRRLGIGGRAALTLERRLEKSVRQVYVSVPARIGLALYFWLRLGYRPLTKAEWPMAPGDAPSTWLVRELR
jgi:GNAT superfamily N-acetyltransferase